MKRAKRIVSLALVGVILMSVLLLGACSIGGDKAYKESITDSGMFANDFESELPQTVVAQIVRDHFNEPLAKGKTQKKAIILGYDGARADGLLNVKDLPYSGSNELAKTGGIYLAFAGGYAGDKETMQRPETAPGWATMLTGVWAKDHKAVKNFESLSSEYPTILTELVQNGKARSSSFHAAWNGHLLATENGRGTYMNEMEYVATNKLAVRFIDYEVPDDVPFDKPVLDALLKEVSNTDCDDLIFSIFERLDSEGHGIGYGNKNETYIQGFNMSEQYAYEVIRAIQDRKTYASEDWLILISADHGGDGVNHNKQNLVTREIFISSNKSLDAYVKAEKEK